MASTTGMTGMTRGPLWALLLLIAGLALGCPQGGQGGQGTGGTGGGGTGGGGGEPTGGPITLKDMTKENTPPEWWTAREDTPWAANPALNGHEKSTADVTLPIGEGEGITVPAGTTMRWLRLKPGYDADPSTYYREEEDVHFKKWHEPGQTYEFKRMDTNQLIIGSIGASSNLNPVLAQDTASSDIIQFVFSRLVDIDRTFDPIPQLCEGFTISPDGLAYTYYLRPGTTFSDGTTLTAADVEFTYMSILNEDVLSPRKGDFKDLDKITIHDENTLTFHLKQRFAPFASNMTYGIMPKKQFELPENRDMNAAEFNKYPVAGGAFMLEKYENEDVYLVRNDNYYGRVPALESMLIKKTPGQELEQKMLQNQELDLGSVMIADLDKVGEENPEIREFRTTVSLGYSYLGFNLKSPFFSDLKVRQAITHAINRQALVEKVIHNHGEIAAANIPPSSPYHNPNLPQYDFNPEKAKSLLAEAGWAVPAGKEYLEKDGRVFTFELLTNDGNPYRKKICELVQIDLKAVGIEAKPRIIEWSSFIDQFIHAHNFEAFVLGWQLSTDPDDYSIFHSSQFEDGLNYGYYANPTVDKLLEEGQREFDVAKRKVIYNQIQEQLATDLPYVFLFYNKKAGGILKRMQGHPQVEPALTSYLVPPLDGTQWWVDGFEFSDGGPMLSPTDN